MGFEQTFDPAPLPTGNLPTGFERAFGYSRVIEQTFDAGRQPNRRRLVRTKIRTRNLLVGVDTYGNFAYAYGMEENGILKTNVTQRHADMWTVSVTVDGFNSEEDYETEEDASRALRTACDELDVAMVGTALFRDGVKVGSWYKGRC